MTAKAKKRKPAYRDYQQALQTIAKEDAAKITYVYGASDFLREKAREVLTQNLLNRGVPVTSVEAESQDAESFRALWEQATLFDPISAYIVKRAERSKTLPKLLESIPQADSITGHLILISGQDKIPAAMTKQLERLQAMEVPCFDPWPSDMPPLINKLAARHQLKLSPDALQVLLDAVGTDLSKLDNELEKLSLLGKEELTGPEIRPHLGLIREDHVFKLDQYLADGDYARAHALTHDLLERGEKGIQLLWVFSNHCRKALQAHQLRDSGASSRDIGFKLRLPPNVAKSYTSLINRTARAPFKRVLMRCQSTDMALKSAGANEELLLAEIIEDLAGRHP